MPNFIHRLPEEVLTTKNEDHYDKSLVGAVLHKPLLRQWIAYSDKWISTVLCLECSLWLRGVLYVVDDCLTAIRHLDVLDRNTLMSA